jgi:hypothetical protein
MGEWPDRKKKQPETFWREKKFNWRTHNDLDILLCTKADIVELCLLFFLESGGVPHTRILLKI